MTSPVGGASRAFHFFFFKKSNPFICHLITKFVVSFDFSFCFIQATGDDTFHSFHSGSDSTSLFPAAHLKPCNSTQQQKQQQQLYYMKDITWHVTLHVVYSFNLIFPVDILHVSNYDFSNTKLPARNIMFPLSLFAFRVSLCAFFGLFFFHFNFNNNNVRLPFTLFFRFKKKNSKKPQYVHFRFGVRSRVFDANCSPVHSTKKRENLFFFKKKKIGIECFEKFNFFWTVFDIFFRIYSTLLSCSLEI